MSFVQETAPYPALAGETYVGYARVQCPAGTGTGSFKIIWVDGLNHELGADTTIWSGTPPTTWTAKTAEAAAPAGTLGARLRCTYTDPGTPTVCEFGGLTFGAAVSASGLTAGAVTTTILADGAVTAGKIADGSITSGKLADSAVTSAKPADGAVTTAKIADGAVTASKLAAGVGVPADGSITTAKLADGAVTAAKIAALTVLATQELDLKDAGGIGNGAITGPSSGPTIQAAPGKAITLTTDGGSAVLGADGALAVPGTVSAPAELHLVAGTAGTPKTATLGTDGSLVVTELAATSDIITPQILLFAGGVRGQIISDTTTLEVKSTGGDLALIAATMTATLAAATGALMLPGDLGLASGKVLKVNATQVVGTQGAAIADLSGVAVLTDVITTVNTILARLRAHGLIAT